MQCFVMMCFFIFKYKLKWTKIWVNLKNSKHKKTKEQNKKEEETNMHCGI